MNQKWILPAGFLGVVVAVGVWYTVTHRAPPPAAEAPPALPPPAAPPAEAPTLHPVPEESAAAKTRTPLPALADSDAPLLAALGEVAGPAAVKDYFVPENVVRRLVVTIDGLARPKLALQKLPVQSVPGEFQAQGDELHGTLDARNYERYKPMVAVIRGLDMQKVADVYVHYYPLFQDAYQNLGYPNGYFNDRLVAVIDVLLATPEVTTPIELTRPRVMYEFADPALEALPSGQKILLRMGPDNAAAIKTQLKELRAILTAGPLKH
jgi:hypothetical protein